MGYAALTIYNGGDHAVAALDSTKTVAQDLNAKKIRSYGKVVLLMITDGLE